MKDKKDRIHEFLDQNGTDAPQPDPKSPEGELLDRYSDALKTLAESRTKAPDDFVERVMTSLPERSRSSGRRWLGRLLPRPLQWTVPAAMGATVTAILLIATFLTKPEFIPLYNQPPVCVPDHYSVQRGGLLRTTPFNGVLANDTDPDTDHDKLKAYLVCPPSHCIEFSLKPDGSFVYRHDNLQDKRDVFIYKDFDGNKFGDPVTVEFTIS